MPETSWIRGLLKKLQHPRIPPAVLPSQFFQGIVILASGIASVFQGLDYIARPEDATFTLTVMERAFHLDIWGYAFIAFSLFAIVGDTFQIWPFAIFGHGSLAIAYSMFGFGVFVSIALDWHGYGWQLGFLYLGVGMFHAMVADGCYDEWAREWERPPTSTDSVEGDGHKYL